VKEKVESGEATKLGEDLYEGVPRGACDVSHFGSGAAHFQHEKKSEK
jgi:hypothetical protein